MLAVSCGPARVARLTAAIKRLSCGYSACRALRAQHSALAAPTGPPRYARLAAAAERLAPLSIRNIRIRGT